MRCCRVKKAEKGTGGRTGYLCLEPRGRQIIVIAALEHNSLHYALSFPQSLHLDDDVVFIPEMERHHDVLFPGWKLPLSATHFVCMDFDELHITIFQSNHIRRTTTPHILCKFSSQRSDYGVTQHVNPMHGVRMAGFIPRPSGLSRSAPRL